MADVSRLPGPNADIWDWQLDAACRGEDSDLFFHPEGERGPSRLSRELAAKSVCSGCPVMVQCAAHALPSVSPTASGAACPRTSVRRSTCAAGSRASAPSAPDPRLTARRTLLASSRDGSGTCCGAHRWRPWNRHRRRSPRQHAGGGFVVAGASGCDHRGRASDRDRRGRPRRTLPSSPPRAPRWSGAVRRSRQRWPEPNASP